jgi:Flp pilus assembly pilin Flp
MSGAVHMILWIKRLWSDNSGQDMIEYALMAAALVVIVAGFLPPALMPSISSIFSKITGLLNSAPF